METSKHNVRDGASPFLYLLYFQAVFLCFVKSVFPQIKPLVDAISEAFKSNFSKNFGFCPNQVGGLEQELTHLKYIK